MGVISTRLPEEMEKELDWYSKKEQLGKAIALRRIIDIGLKEIRLEYALDLYKKGKVTLMKAGEIAGLSLWGILKIVRERKIPMYYTKEDAMFDIETAKDI